MKLRDLTISKKYDKEMKRERDRYLIANKVNLISLEAYWAILTTKIKNDKMLKIGKGSIYKFQRIHHLKT